MSPLAAASKAYDQLSARERAEFLLLHVPPGTAKRIRRFWKGYDFEPHDVRMSRLAAHLRAKKANATRRARSAAPQTSGTEPSA